MVVSLNKGTPKSLLEGLPKKVSLILGKPHKGVPSSVKSLGLRVQGRWSKILAMQAKCL